MLHSATLCCNYNVANLNNKNMILGLLEMADHTLYFFPGTKGNCIDFFCIEPFHISQSFLKNKNNWSSNMRVMGS